MKDPLAKGVETKRRLAASAQRIAHLSLHFASPLAPGVLRACYSFPKGEQMGAPALEEIARTAEGVITIVDRESGTHTGREEDWFTYMHIDVMYAEGVGEGDEAE